MRMRMRMRMRMLWIWIKEDIVHPEGTAPQCVVGNI